MKKKGLHIVVGSFRDIVLFFSASPSLLNKISNTNILIPFIEMDHLDAVPIVKGSIYKNLVIITRKSKFYFLNLTNRIFLYILYKYQL